MNLVEFPLSPVTDRFLDGRKTVVFSGQVWDRQQRAFVRRELALSGSDRYGLPTARDEDVLLACVQLTRLAEFQSRTVHFSRYELLKLLRWPDEGKYYRRLATALRRWKGVTVYSNRAFYDHAQKSWVNRDFGILDNLYLYERETAARASTPAPSWFVWNEVIFSSFQAGYLKHLNWDLYRRLSDPVARRLYRLLDKRFFHSDEVVFDLHELAFRKVRVSDKYNTGQIKRALARGIRELETLWELQPLPPERRFRNNEQGRWEIVFRRKRPRRQAAVAAERGRAQAADLEVELTRREIGPAMAAELVSGYPPDRVRLMIELYDWYRARGQAKGPGFLVESIRKPEQFRLPRGFEPPSRPEARKRDENSRNAAGREYFQRREARQRREENARQESFTAFWNGLGQEEQKAFEEAAVRAASPTKRDGYLRLLSEGGLLFEQYQRLILLDHFEKTAPARKARALGETVFSGQPGWPR